MGKKLKRNDFVIWMTGLPCAGKSTIARKLRENIENIAVLDGDELREWLSPKDFSKEGRDEHNRKVAHLAKLLANHHVPVVVSLISPFRENREMARQIIGRDRFFETYVKCPLEVCEKRDVKGMYKKARNNEIKNFTGLQDPYEEPTNPEIIVNTENETVEDTIKKIISRLEELQIITMAN